MSVLNITILGGGSAYTPGLIEALMRLKERVPVDRLVLMDVDKRKLDIVGALVQAMVSRKSPGTTVALTTDRRESLAGADFVLCQIRVGGLAARRLDERIPMKYGVIGQETTGPGGFAMALRTIPVMVDVARDMEELCPDAWLINYTNPTGMVEGGIKARSNIRVLSICDIPAAILYLVAHVQKLPVNSLRLDYVGLNHLGWVRRIFHGGTDILPRLLSMAKFLNAIPQQLIPSSIIGVSQKDVNEILKVLRLAKVLGVLPSPYLQYYYLTDEILKEQSRLSKTRAEEVMEIEEELLSHYAAVSKGREVDLWKQRGGDWHADMMVSVLSAIANDTQEEFVVNVPNGNSVRGMDPGAIIEIPCKLGSQGATPLPLEQPEPWMLGLMQVVSQYERLTIEAALEGSQRKALLALITHPLVPSITTAERILNDYLKAHKEFLPQFK